MPMCAERIYAYNKTEKARIAMILTLVIRPCMIRKFGLLMLSCTLWKSVWMACCVDLWPLTRYFERFGIAIYMNSLVVPNKPRVLGSTHLSSDCNLRVVLHTNRTCTAVGVVKDDGDAGFRDTGLTSLVDEILLVLRTHLEHIWILKVSVRRFKKNTLRPRQHPTLPVLSPQACLLNARNDDTTHRSQIC